MYIEKGEVHEVMKALQNYQHEIDHIINLLDRKKIVSRDDVEYLRAKLKELKQSLKSAAKTGTVGGRNQPQNQIERLYFEPAVFKASANFRVKTSSHPIKSNWVSGLFSVRLDIAFYLDQLEAGELVEK